MSEDSENNDQRGLLRSSGGSVLRESKAWISSHKNNSQSLDFTEMESIMWSKHQLRRFYQDRGNVWTNSKKTTAWKWILVILTGVIIALLGVFVQISTQYLISWKNKTVYGFVESAQSSKGFFAYFAINILFSLVAGILCWIEPFAAGSGIPEIKAFLNGVNLNKVVRINVLFAKVVGMIFSVASGLPLGKEGPMIHTGSIVGAAISQGKTITFGFDTSWTKFQDLRNDLSKRDFVTFGAAAGVAAAFQAPIGGILFTLEEGASFWSTSLTFRSFFCALMTQLTLTIVYEEFSKNTDSSTISAGIQFGQFENNSTNPNWYYPYELITFMLMGVFGGVFGAFFNSINERVSKFRMANYNHKWQKLAELLLLTSLFSIICFSLPLMFNSCTALPTQTASWPTSEYEILTELPQFNCPSGQYNQLASLYLTSSDTAMQALFHLSEVDGVQYTTFSTETLLLFFIPYFLVAAITSGTFCPAGLFVPTLMAGAAYGRLVGHVLNTAFRTGIADSGIYALMGAAAILGGMSRMTIAGAVILLEASGNTVFLLPLMLTFAAARYAGNAINKPMYEMQIELKEMPFLEEKLKSVGLLNYHPVEEIMTSPVVTIEEVERVSSICEKLRATDHNGFPVVDRDGRLKGMILRKVLCSLLKNGMFSVPANAERGEGNTVVLAGKGEMFHEHMERNYPHYPEINDIEIAPENANSWLDVRQYMDMSPFAVNEAASVKRSYAFFRLLGLRHLIVVDGEHKVTGILSRRDLTEHRMEHHWFQEQDNMAKFLKSLDPAVVVDVPQSPRGGGGAGGAAMGAQATSTTFDIRAPSVDVSSVAPVGTYTAPQLQGQTFTSSSIGMAGASVPPSGGATPVRSTREGKALKEPKSMRV